MEGIWDIHFVEKNTFPKCCLGMGDKAASLWLKDMDFVAAMVFVENVANVGF